MTKLLASVTGPEEAEIALAAGADVIDLKDPALGAFAAVTRDVAEATVARVAGRRAVSVVTGETPMRPDAVLAAAEPMAMAGVAYLKQGIFPGGDAAACLRALAPLAARVELIAVLFADAMPDPGLLDTVAEAGFAGAMLDTMRKDGRRLLDHLALPWLRSFVGACRERRLIVGLAGALEAPDVPRLLVLEPDILGFRGALCGAGGRRGAIDREATLAIRSLIPIEATHADQASVDYTLLAARGYAPDPLGDAASQDRIYVRDLVLPVRIGLYARERLQPQRVRFEVEAVVARPSRPTQDLRDIVSYDLITDAINMAANEGHIPLVETLAERIAAALLAHPQVRKVSARLEKLDTGSGVVGVLIERSRDSVAGWAAQSLSGNGAARS